MTVRNPNDDLKAPSRARAAETDRSGDGCSPVRLGSRIHERFARFVLDDDIELPARGESGAADQGP
jgi:hypothetical protein